MVVMKYRARHKERHFHIIWTVVWAVNHKIFDQIFPDKEQEILLACKFMSSNELDGYVYLNFAKATPTQMVLIWPLTIEPIWIRNFNVLSHFFKNDL